MGKVVGNCDCCGGDGCGDCTSPTNCTGGTGLAECYELVVAGVTDDGCADCDENYNGTFLLIKESTPPVPYVCSWATVEEAPCGAIAGTPLYRMGVLGNTLQLFADQVGAEFEGAVPLGNCCRPVDLPFKADVVGDCDNWPATVTVEPMACP